MIEYIKGELTELTPTLAVIDCGGVGYGLNISLTTYAAIQGKDHVMLYVYEAIREDAFVLWGFGTKAEREMFLLLITVSGIGAGTARMILSAFSVAELCNIISDDNHKMLKSVKGIGPKAAQRIIVDLKDKIASLGIDTTSAVGIAAKAAEPSINQEVRDEAVAALTMLGFSPAPTQKVVVNILTDEPDAPVEKVIKLALKML